MIEDIKKILKEAVESYIVTDWADPKMKDRKSPLPESEKIILLKFVDEMAGWITDEMTNLFSIF